MIAIQNKLISEDIFKVHFVCELNACKGACCWEGDFGAPLVESELKTLDEIWPKVKNYISKESISILEKKGAYSYIDELKSYVTNLKKDGACVFMTKDELGVAQCGIEQAYKAGEIDFQKPISCHLYPIRVKENPQQGFTAINYDEWKICSPACKNGERLGVPLYKFVKTALIKKFGIDFYNELEEVAKQLESDKN